MPVIDIADPMAARAVVAEMVARAPATDQTGLTVRDVHAPGADGAPDVALRLYLPEGTGGPVPAVYHIHGGGYVLGSVDLAHPRCVELARDLRGAVVAVEYRLAPEHPFPAGLEDCYAGLTWLAEHATELGIDPGRIAVHGESAGGGLAAATALLARDRGGPPLRFQLLAVPELDDRLSTHSMTIFTDTPRWNRPKAIVSWESYLGPGLRGTRDVSPYAAPARADDLSGLPPAYLSTMHFDPLRDEGIAYAARLIEAGVMVELHHYPGTFHGASAITEAQVSQRLRIEEAAVLSRALYG
ncbi:MAG: alpha/beta hydrolase fold domain-containing protein [Propionibacteriales bacterium]|nr:alpha/beta hydrolase fold domain-containing protein [Propionibacteriales bacterium]